MDEKTTLIDKRLLELNHSNLIVKPGDLARGGPDNAADNVQGRRFAGSVGAEKTDDLTGSDAKRQSVDDFIGRTQPTSAAPRFGQLDQLEDVRVNRIGGGGGGEDSPLFAIDFGSRVGSVEFFVAALSIAIAIVGVCAWESGYHEKTANRVARMSSFSMQMFCKFAVLL